ncbi:unnamed protein product [Adineta steineri]|uniref:Uncharacterized protein n=1 Tax=Adineta steineri TaxID=433720 RepID=A0A813S1R3_9BILA|nr:unnamed protein product [Adineta steineri]
MPVRLLLESSYKTVREKWRTWNTFDSRSSDPLIIRREILSTHLYIILVIISLVILITYNSLSNQVENKTVISPSQSVYQNLQKKYTDSLQCSCTKVSILYKNFVKTVPSFHQVCSSNFTSQEWIDFVFKADLALIWPIDVRTSLSAMWQLIRSFCQSSTITIMDVLDQFDNTPLINSIVLTEEVLKVRVQATLSLLLQMAASNFIQSTTVVHNMTQVNQFATGLSTNYITTMGISGLSEQNSALLGPNMAPLSFHLSMYGNKYILKNSTAACFCGSNGSCPHPGNLYLYNASDKLGTYNLNEIEANQSLSGLIIDCTPIQMTFSSSLECFYNQSCLNILLSSYPTKINISILNQSSPTRFHSTTKIEFLIHELFIEEIFNETSYTQYYSQCQPNVCHYSYSSRLNWIFVVTILIGLVGGVITVLRIITPFIIQLCLFLKKRFCSKQLQEVRQTENETIRIRLTKFFQQIKTRIINFNLYSQYSRDPIRVYHGLLGTRLYICLLFIAICTIILFSDLSNQTVTKTVPYPSVEEYEKLQKQYSTKLLCPCTQLSIPYEDMIKTEVKYHQICSSDFVQSWWYQVFLPFHDYQKGNSFLSFASSYFEALSTFCDIANTTINDAIKRFSTKTFVNTHLLSNDSFISQVKSLSSAFVELTRTEFLYGISLTNAILHSNQYINNLQMNTEFVLPRDKHPDGRYSIRISILARFALNRDGSKCYCILNSTCDLNYKTDSESERSNLKNCNWELEGIHGGCSIINTVLKSSLICWFKKSCLTRLQLLFSKEGVSIPLAITPLNPRLSSRYSSQTSIETIFNEIMIEKWNFDYSFSKFYHKCKPSYCSFTYEKETNIIYIITIIISLIGGINIILKLISPFIIKIIWKFIGILKHCRASQVPTIQQENHQDNGTDRGIINLMNRLKDKVLMLNIFNSESSNIEIIRHERISTRLYLLCFSIAVYIIIMYTIYLDIINANKSISSPSENEYNSLLMSHSQLLDCPCKKASIEHKYFIKIDTRFHAICSSDFINEKLINYLFRDSLWYNFDRRDIRVRGSVYFSFLSTLCQISETTVKKAIDQFLNDTFTSSQLISKSEFQLQIDNIISQFQKLTCTKFSRSLELIRDITNGNAFVSSYLLNWYWWIDLYHNYSATITLRPILMKDGCSCGTRSDCIDSGGIYDNLSNWQRWAIPGWNVGCSVVETVLRSTFECFYDQACVDLVVFYVPNELDRDPYLMNISAINSSIDSRFKRNTIIQNIANELFVEEWKISNSYSSFYNQCAPVYCSYKSVTNDYVIYTVSKVLGLYGGLTVALQFSIPLLVKIIFQIQNQCRRNTINPNE